MRLSGSGLGPGPVLLDGMARILVVAFSVGGKSLTNILERAGHDVTVAGSASEASTMLARSSPDLLLSELRLGAFNGIHLAIRHRSSHPKMRTIILDSAYDPVLAGDARHCEATYLVEPVSEAQLLTAVSRTLTEKVPSRRWPRKRPHSPVEVNAAEQVARVLDLSYGGLRLETERAANFPGPFHVVFARSGVAIDARPVWSRLAPSGSWWHGAEVSISNSDSEDAWRQFVDSMQSPS